MKKQVLSYIYIAFGCFLTAIGISMFFVPNKIAAGGVTGIATILYYKMGIPVSVSALVINILLFIAGYKMLNKTSIFKTLYASVLLSIFIEITSRFFVFQNDLILCAIYGGIIIGAGIGICIANSGSTGGTDFAAVMINKLVPSVSVGVIMLFIDSAIIIVSAILFNDFNLVLYNFFALALSIKTTDYIVEGLDFARSVFIISEKYEEISQKILYDFDRGVTAILCKGMYTNENKTALLCIVKPRQVAKLKKKVKEIDKNAFIILTDVRQTLGEGFKE